MDMQRRQKISESMRKAYAEGRLKHIVKQQERKRLTLTCQNCSIDFEVIPSEAKFRKYCSISCAQKSVGFKKGHEAWNKTKAWSPEVRKRISKGRLGIEPWNKGKHLPQELRERLSHIRKGWKPTTETRRRMSESAKRAYAEGRRYFSKPNLIERHLRAILDTYFPNQWFYTGDNKVRLGERCPDFFAIGESKKVIEVFGNYWHEKDEEKVAREHYKKFGFEVLILWEDFLKTSSKVEIKDKIDVFLS